MSKTIQSIISRVTSTVIDRDQTTVLSLILGELVSPTSGLKKSKSKGTAFSLETLTELRT